jgi:hypothetical protein
MKIRKYVIFVSMEKKALFVIIVMALSLQLHSSTYGNKGVGRPYAERDKGGGRPLVDKEKSF